ncbi:hypothetical protein VTL71DRAFT_4815 [Oculimacula yallundae]|uniref:Uncharacterized protein n=1 Tax=Oculimacula yallundae TaxID=86028 RepID=A0ABR4C4Q3_9HELO
MKDLKPNQESNDNFKFGFCYRTRDTKEELKFLGSIMKNGNKLYIFQTHAAAAVGKENTVSADPSWADDNANLFELLSPTKEEKDKADKEEAAKKKS